MLRSVFTLNKCINIESVKYHILNLVEIFLSVYVCDHLMKSNYIVRLVLSERKPIEMILILFFVIQI